MTKDSYVIVWDGGDGNFCRVVSPPMDLRTAMHEAMCFCGKSDWRECETESVAAGIALVDNNDNWVYSNGWPFSIV